MTALVSVFTVALMHTLIPSHWLCFVVVGRAHGWSTSKTLSVAALAASLHVISTVALGVAGAQLLGTVFGEEESFARASALLLIGLGVLYLAMHLFHVGHHHEHDAHPNTERAAYATLLVSLILSPCTITSSALVATAGGSPLKIALFSAVLLVTTVGGMLVLVGLTTLGVEKLRFTFFDRFEKLIVGFVLIALGVLVLLLPHHDH